LQYVLTLSVEINPYFDQLVSYRFFCFRSLLYHQAGVVQVEVLAIEKHDEIEHIKQARMVHIQVIKAFNPLDVYSVEELKVERLEFERHGSGHDAIEQAVLVDHRPNLLHCEVVLITARAEKLDQSEVRLNALIVKFHIILEGLSISLALSPEKDHLSSELLYAVYLYARSLWRHVEPVSQVSFHGQLRYDEGLDVRRVLCDDIKHAEEVALVHVVFFNLVADVLNELLTVGRLPLVPDHLAYYATRVQLAIGELKQVGYVTLYALLVQHVVLAVQ